MNDDRILEMLEWHAERISWSAGRMKLAAEWSAEPYHFHTRMEAELEKAEKELTDALMAVRNAKESYRKPRAA